MSEPIVDPALLLRNVLADALAIYEAGAATGETIVRLALPAGTAPEVAWLDYERAAEVAAAALTPAGVDAEGRALYAIPSTHLGGRVLGGAVGVASSPAAPAVVSDPDNLGGQLLGLAREVFPVQARRHSWMLGEMRRLVPGAGLGDLHQLSPAHLRTLIERLEAYRNANRLADLAPGVHRPGGAELAP